MIIIRIRKNTGKEKGLYLRKKANHQRILLLLYNNVAIIVII